MGTALLQASAVCATVMALNRMGLAQSTCILSFGESIELVKPYSAPFDDSMMLSLLSTVRSAESLASLDADGIAAAAAMLTAHSGFGPSFMLVFSDGYGSRGLKLTATLANVAKMGINVVAISVGGDSDVKSNGLAHSYANWTVCTSHLSYPSALQAWASCFRGVDAGGATGKPDSSGFAAAELMSAGEEGCTSIEEVWDKKYGGFFTNLDAQLNEERRVFVKDGGKESGGGVVKIDLCFVMDCTYVCARLWVN